MTTESFPDELLLIDLSSLAHPLFHMSTDPSTMHVALVDRIRALASQHPHCGVFCDSGKSFRADIDPTYKANRPESDAVLHHEIALAVETLKGDGFPVVSVKGYEADDLIASATYRALEIPDTTVLIATADKDLLALVNGRVRVKSLTKGDVLDAAAVEAKMGVGPEQIADYLALVGDKSDNIVGAKGIGKVTATLLLKSHGSLDGVYRAMDGGDGKMLTPSIANSLAEFRTRWPTVRQLIALKTDVPVPFAEIAAERVPKNQEPEMFTTRDTSDPMGNVVENMLDAQIADGSLAELKEQARAAWAAQGIVPSKDVSTLDVKRVEPRTATEILAPPHGPSLADQLAPAPVEFERQLDPRSMPQAKTLAQWMFAARLFQGYGNADAVLAAIIAGRELGLAAGASLRAFDVIEGKLALKPEAMRGLILRSGKARYFRNTERTPEAATFETQRGDEPPVTLRYTLEEAIVAGVVKDRGGYKKNPADMMVARASGKLARLVYPDVIGGFYTPEELRD